MRERESSVSSSVRAVSVVLGGMTGLLAIGFLVAGILAIGMQQVSAKPEYARSTGRPCVQCHVNPAGSGPLKPFGQKFKSNGYQIK